MNITFTFDNGDVWSFDEFQKYLTEYFSSIGGNGSGCFGVEFCKNCMFQGEFIGDCNFASSNNIKLLKTTANKLHEWKMSHIITNIDHYAIEFNWTPEQKERVGRLGTPLPNFMETASKIIDTSRKWWLQEYQPKGAKV